MAQGEAKSSFHYNNCLVNAGNVRDADSIPGSGRSPGVGNGTPLQYSRLEDSMGRGAWQTIVHKVARSQIRLID